MNDTSSTTSPRPAALELIGCGFAYRRKGTALPVLRDATLRVERGETVGVVGRSGTGKSTLLSIAAGLTRPAAGTVAIDGTDITTASAERRARVRRDGVGMVFQDFRLLAPLNALENVAVPLQLQGWSRGDALERAREQLAAVGLESRAAHRRSELSGGEQQRVAVARATISTPALLLADEPTGSLDQALRDEILDLILDLGGQGGAGIVLVTHDPEVASRASRTVTVSGGTIESQAGLAT